jgi:hypothetical protein
VTWKEFDPKTDEMMDDLPRIGSAGLRSEKNRKIKQENTTSNQLMTLSDDKSRKDHLLLTPVGPGSKS